MQAEAREGLVAEIRRELKVEIEARVALAQRLEHKSEEAARLERQNAVLLQHLREGGAREEQVREATAQRRDAAEKLQRALAVNSKLRPNLGMLEQELEVSRGARAELEKSMNVQNLLDSAELNSTEAIHSSMAQISAAPTPVEALGPLGELTSHLNTYRAEWSKAQAPIELDALRGAFAHLSSKLQEAEASRQEAANAVVQMQVDLQKREQERAAAAEQEAAAAAAAAERSLPQVAGGVPPGDVASVPLPSPPTTSQPDFSFTNARAPPWGGLRGPTPAALSTGSSSPRSLGARVRVLAGGGPTQACPPRSQRRRGRRPRGAGAVHKSTRRPKIETGTTAGTAGTTGAGATARGATAALRRVWPTSRGACRKSRPRGNAPWRTSPRKPCGSLRSRRWRRTGSSANSTGSWAETHIYYILHTMPLTT